MNCPKCGTENPNDAKSCWSCNSALTSTPATSPQQAQQAKTSGLAITSLVLGILSIFTCFMTAIPAIIFGIVALVKIGKSAGQLKGSGLAIAGIAIPPASLPIVALLMGIMMPALARTRQIAFRMVCGTNLSGISKAMLIYANDYNETRVKAQRMVCATNLSGLGKAMLIYANDYNDMYPTSSKWCDLLIEHAEVNQKSFCCKGAQQGPCNYAMNKNVEKLGTLTPPDMVLLFESGPGWNQAGGPEILTTDNHQGQGCNVLFVDGHVEFIKAEYLNNLKWDAKENQIQPPEPIPLPP
jgi:prepilin-type processing-associated H-X9-DG protein